MAKVYVSSTFDLQEERAAARDALLRIGLVPAVSESPSSQRLLPSVRADIAKCSIYLGILGWRYGYEPPDGGRKSMVELEYEAAKGKPRFIYVSPDRPRWTGKVDEDVSKITRFRQRVGEEQRTGAYSDADHLKFQIAADLKPGRNSGHALLPHLCDRNPQHVNLAQVIARSRAEQNRRPYLCVVHGDNKQAIYKYIDCLKQKRLPELFELPADDDTVTEYQVHWPLPRDPEASLLANVALKVCNGVAGEQQLMQALESNPQPIMLTFSVPTNDVKRLEATLPAFRRFWGDCRFAPRSNPVVVVLWAAYPRPGLLKFWQKGRNDRIREALGEVAQEPYLLPQLPDVELVDVHTWSRLDAVREAVGGADLEPDLKQIYASEDALPMEDLAGELKLVLQKHGKEWSS